MRRSPLNLLALEDRLTPVTLQEGFAISSYARGLTAPTAMVEAPDGRIFIAEQTGSIRVINANGGLLPEPAVTFPVDLLSIERGILGITVDPDFKNNNYVYIYYTVIGNAQVPVHNRVSRFTMTGNSIDRASEFVVVDIDPVSHGAHNGGAIHFLADGTLLVAVGDDGHPENGQRVGHFAKILRFNADGTIPADNPETIDGLTEQPTGKYKAIYATGLRNPFTFSIDPVTSRIFVNDVGQDTFEEVNELLPGKNYGWPVIEGNFSPTAYPNYTPPILSYAHGQGTTRGYAVTGGVFYRTTADQFPADFNGDYFYADFANNWIRRYDPVTGADELFVSDISQGAMVDLDIHNDGSLLVLSRGNGGPGQGQVLRIQFTNLPLISQEPESLILTVGRDATYTVLATGTGELQYQWQRNGEDIPGANSPTYTLTNVALSDSDSRFRVVVTNAFGFTTSREVMLVVTTDRPPVPVIDLPVLGTTFEMGQTFSFAGTAIDPEDGELGSSAFTWRVDYHTGGAPARPLLTDSPGIKGGSITLPTNSPYTRTDVFFRFILTVRDSFGNTATVSRDIQPITGTATLTSDLPGATLFIDGTPHEPGFQFDGVVGQERTLSASESIVVDGVTLPFVGWSDGVFDRSRTISVAANGRTFQANYSEAFFQSIVTPFAVGNGAGRNAGFRIVDAATGSELNSFDLDSIALPPGVTFTEARVARGDLTGDGVPDFAIGNGEGGMPYVVVVDGATMTALNAFQVFEPTFTGGVFVSIGDLDGDGVGDLVVTPDRGGGPRIRVFRSGNPFSVVADFFGIDDPDFRGGARASLGDVNGDGRVDLVVAAGFEGGPRVATYDGRTVSDASATPLFNDFFAFEETLRNGVFVTVADIDGDGKADIVAGGGPGGGPRVIVYSAATLLQTNELRPLANFFAGDENERNGVRLATANLRDDAGDDLIVGTAPGGTAHVFIYRASELTTNSIPTPFRTLDVFDEDFTGGVFVG